MFLTGLPAGEVAEVGACCGGVVSPVLVPVMALLAGVFRAEGSVAELDTVAVPALAVDVVA